MHQALRIDKRNVLRFGRINPEDVIRVKIARLEEAHANLALVAKQIQGFVHQLRCVVVYVCLEIVHKPHFVGVQRNGRQLYFQIALFKTNQRGVQMRSKIEQNQLAVERIFFVNVEPVIRLQHSGHLRNESLSSSPVGSIALCCA